MNLFNKIKYVISGEEGQSTQEIGVWLITVSIVFIILFVFKDEVNYYIDVLTSKLQ